MKATKPSGESATAGPRVRRSKRGFLALAILGLGLASPQIAAAQFSNLMKSVAPMIPATGAKPAAPSGAVPSGASASPGAANRPAGAGQPPGAMGMQAPTALAPLHKLGTDAVAVVETATPKAPVHEMDYVFAKQTIALGPAGKITLSYLSGCLSQSIQGGTVTVELGGSSVAGGKHQEKTTPGCHAAHPVVLASASEAGATVNRITPFTGVDWDERTLKSGQPVFKWDAALKVNTVQVKDMDKTGEPVIWQAPAGAQGWIAYPPKTGALATGAPYKAEALAAGKVVASALFSIDPSLDVADNLANRVVPLAAP